MRLYDDGELTYCVDEDVSFLLNQKNSPFLNTLKTLDTAVIIEHVVTLEI